MFGWNTTGHRRISDGLDNECRCYDGFHLLKLIVIQPFFLNLGWCLHVVEPLTVTFLRRMQLVYPRLNGTKAQLVARYYLDRGSEREHL